MRLIDADKLKETIKSPETFTTIPVKKHMCKIIDNAPTFEQKEFEQVLQPIKVNIPKDITDKLIEELSKPRKVILDESETFNDCIIAYSNGFESARRLFERPHGEWQLKDKLREGFYICSNCGEISCCKGNFCSDCGADMRGEE